MFDLEGKEDKRNENNYKQKCKESIRENLKCSTL